MSSYISHLRWALTLKERRMKIFILSSYSLWITLMPSVAKVNRFFPFFILRWYGFSFFFLFFLLIFLFGFFLFDFLIHFSFWILSFPVFFLYLFFFTFSDYLLLPFLFRNSGVPGARRSWPLQILQPPNRHLLLKDCNSATIKDFCRLGWTRSHVMCNALAAVWGKVR